MRKSGINTPHPKTTGGGSKRVDRNVAASAATLPNHNKSGKGSKGSGNGPKPKDKRY